MRPPAAGGRYPGSHGLARNLALRPNLEATLANAQARPPRLAERLARGRSRRRPGLDGAIEDLDTLTDELRRPPRPDGGRPTSGRNGT